MKSVPSEPSDLVLRLRQQLILAQVRIMELEDERDSLAPRLAEVEQLLSGAQVLADRKMDEAAHLEKILADLAAQCEHLRSAQQLAGTELASARAELADAAARVAQRDEVARRLESTLGQLEAELRTIKASRSWRWTAWLRAPGGKT